DPTDPSPRGLGRLPPSVGRRGAQRPRAPAPAACFDAGKKSLLPSLRPTPSGSEAALAPCTAGQLLDVYEFCDRDGLDDQLRDAVSAADGMGVGVVCVEQDHVNLASVARVYRTGCVENCNPRSCRKP